MVREFGYITVEMKSSLVFFLLLCGMAVCQIMQYVFINEKMNWFSAQRYCRENYVDLAAITTDTENQRLIKLAAAIRYVDSWIGLNRTASGSNIWQWSNGEPPNYFNWAPGQPDNAGGAESCVVVWSTGWDDADCQVAYSFYCFWRFVLVNDSKTWVEALEYCRTYYNGLASPISINQLMLAKNAISQTQTVRVWTGLRFMNGQWVSGDNVALGSLVSLPSCPALPYHCGAYNNNTYIWENRDCSEKLNFLCY